MKLLFAAACTLVLLSACAPPPTSSGNVSQSAGSSNGGASNDANVGRSSDDSRVYPRADLKTVTVSLNGKPFKLWVMDTDGKRQEGMMFLRDEDVKDDEGMLFAFPDVQESGEANGFWMRNTYIPLDIIYLSPDGRVVNVGKGEPFSEKTVPPAGSYQNVIELKSGTAERIGLKPGMQVELPKDLKPTSDPLPTEASPVVPQ